MAKSPYYGPERRQYPRIPFWYIVKYRIHPEKKEQFRVQSKNLSLGGILLETNNYYPLSTVLEIEIDLPLDIKNHVCVRVLGQVVRSTVIESDKAYDTAVQFTSVPGRYQEQIRRLIELFIKS